MAAHDEVSSRIYADFTVLEQGAQNFERTLKEFEDTLENLDAQLQLSLSEWTGDARDAFRKFHDVWRKEASELAGQLARLRRVIATSHDNYRRSRDANLGMWDVW